MKDIKKILVYVYEDLLGDCILKLPFVYALRQSFPKAHIIWCAGGGKSLYASCLAPLVDGELDEILEIPLGRSWAEFLKESPLKGHFFDLILDTQRDLKTTLMLKKIPHNFFVSRTHRFFFSDFKPKKGQKPGPHLSEQLLFFLELLKVPSFTVGRHNRKHLDLFVKEVAPLFEKHKEYVGLAPGAGNIKKCWPLDRFIEVARYIVTQKKIPIFILGPEEQKWYDHLKEAVPEALFPLQTEKKFLESPFYTSAMGFFLKAVVANDSGTGHLLSLSDVTLISLFGPTRMEKIHPLAKKSFFIKASDFGGVAMDGIPLQSVIKALDAC